MTPPDPPASPTTEADRCRGCGGIGGGIRISAFCLPCFQENYDLVAAEISTIVNALATAREEIERLSLAIWGEPSPEMTAEQTRQMAADQCNYFDNFECNELKSLRAAAVAKDAEIERLAKTITAIDRKAMHGCYTVKCVVCDTPENDLLLNAAARAGAR